MVSRPISRLVPAERSGEAAAAFAHEICNPLESLLNLLFLLQSEAILTEKGRHYLALMREETDRLSQLAHSALTEFRETKKPAVTSVPELLASVLDFYHWKLDSRQINVRSRFCEDGHLAIFAGPLRQSLVNLLLNAMDAMPTGGTMHARVAITHERNGLCRKGLRVTIADTGVGISANNIRRITEPFFTTKGEGGSGIGLALVKDTVQRHGGKLRIRSRTAPGQSGTVFSIFLPMS